MAISPISSGNPSLFASKANAPRNDMLQRLLAIQESAASPSERSRMLRLLQKEQEGEYMKVHFSEMKKLQQEIDKIQAESAAKTQTEVETEEKETNANDDSVEISDAAREAYAKSLEAATANASSSSSPLPTAPTESAT
ncbi:hypothetical protein [Paenibacillus sp. GCM10027626]|uniref:hypothetical protein n=1 Tax=Paenibacillus sp. GCM10027626 TaxID=3273411 RepID=UPI0036372360